MRSQPAWSTNSNRVCDFETTRVQLVHLKNGARGESPAGVDRASGR